MLHSHAPYRSNGPMSPISVYSNGIELRNVHGELVCIIASSSSGFNHNDEWLFIVVCATALDSSMPRHANRMVSNVNRS